MRSQQTFDERNRKWYVLALHVILFSHASIVVFSLMGRAPKFSEDDLATAFWYTVSAICSGFLAWLVDKERMRGSYGMCVVAIVNALCAFLSGASPEKSMTAAAGAFLFLVVLLLAGEKGNKNSPERTIKIRFPWL